MLRLLLLPIVILVRVLSAPFQAYRRARAAPVGAHVELRLRGAIRAGPARPRGWWPPAIGARGRAQTPVSIVDVRRLVDEAIGDARVAGVLVTIESIAAGWATLHELRGELGRLRRAGKRVTAWLPHGGGNRELFIASVAEKIVAPRSVDIGAPGAAASGVFLRGLLDRAGVDVDLIARKEFKSAGDALARTERTDEDRLQNTVLVSAIDGAIEGALADGRGVSIERARAWMDDGLVRAASAKESGLIDATVFDDALPALVGAPLVRAGRYLAARRGGRDRRPLLGRRRSIGIVEIHGAIAEARSPLPVGGPGANEAQVVADLRLAARDRSIVGVLLDVDSPGGTVTASDAIFAAARAVAAHKPIVVRMGDVAASGGYFVAMAGASIVASPLTITGSIGVVSIRPILARLLERFGVTRDAIARHRFADQGGLLRAPTDEERAHSDREIDAHYDAFVRHVADGRGKAFDLIEPLARGRVYIGTDARAVGLVDELGGMPEAIAALTRRITGATISGPPRIVVGKAPSDRLDPPANRAAAQLFELIPASIREPLRPLVVALDEHSPRVWAILPPGSDVS